MKSKHLIFAAAAVVLTVAACRQEEKIGVPDIQVTPATVSFANGASSQTVTLTATRDWTVSGAPEWLAFDPSSGKASSSSQTVTITAMANSGYNRSVDLVFSIGLMKAYVHVDQVGDKGVFDKGDGSKERPYSASAAYEYVSTLSADIEAGPVYVRGIISAVNTTYEASGTYGNATFDISDDGSTAGTQFKVYQTYYLGNKKWTAGNDDVKVGDEVIVHGKVVNYHGNTPETVGKGGSYVYSLNGKTGGGSDAPAGDPKGTGSKDDPFNVAAAINAVKDLSWTSKDVYDKVGPYYVKGKITSIEEEYGTQFGNGSFRIADKDGEADFYVYRALYLGNKKFTSGKTQIKVGDEVVIYGELMNYHNDTPETVQNSAYLYSLNGKTGDSDTPPPSGGDPQGSGTKDDPFNVAAAINAVKDLGWTSKDVYDKVGPFYVKGKITSIEEEYGTQFGNGTFRIADKDGEAEFYVYRALYLENKKFASGNTQIQVGDEVVIYGELMNYHNDTPETVQNSAYLYSLNGKTADGDTPPPAGDDTPAGTGTLEDPYNAAGVLEYIKTLSGTDESPENVYVKGKISSIKFSFSAQYGTATFNISESGTTSGSQFTCYSVYYLQNKSWENGNIQIKTGDEVIICGKVYNYEGNTPETVSKNAYVYSLNGKTEDDGSGQGGGGDDQPTGDFASNVSWTAGSDSSYDEKATVNGTADVPVLKLGTSSKTGSSTLTLPEGSTSLTFYALSWKDKPSKAVFKVNGTEVASVEPAANSGLSNKEPYTLTVTDSDKYTITFSATSTLTVETTGANTRIAFFGIQAK